MTIPQTPQPLTQGTSLLNLKVKSGFGDSGGNFGDDPGLSSHTSGSHTCSTPPPIAPKTDTVTQAPPPLWKTLTEHSPKQQAQDLLIRDPIWPGAVEVESESKQILS